MGVLLCHTTTAGWGDGAMGAPVWGKAKSTRLSNCHYILAPTSTRAKLARWRGT